MEGYFKLDDNITCKKCKYPCTVCDKVEDYCLYCADFPPVGPNNGNRLQPPTCACEKGFSEGGPTLGCIICNDPCLTCNSYATDDCNSCIDEYYLDGNQCIDCKPGCKTCKPDDINYCLNGCVDGYYFDSSLNTCHKCPSPCATCLNANYCLTCGYGAVRRIW